MTEEFLHYIWKFRLFDRNRLTTEDGEALEIVETGQHNRDAGPDFFNARIKIGNTLWAGNVEIHCVSSDWKKHRHGNDPAYDNTILHVVFRNDTNILRSDKSSIPVLVLENRIPEGFQKQYARLAGSPDKIPCASRLPEVDPFISRNWLGRVAVERFEQKYKKAAALLSTSSNNLEQVFYQLLARSFGHRVNSVPFEQLARALPYKLIAKHKDKLQQLEALLFGQAGFLEGNMPDEYGRSLQKEYRYLEKKHALRPFDKSTWKFLRMRPAAFPTLRLSQFAAFLYKAGPLADLADVKNNAQMTALFKVHAHPYWKDHTAFGQPCTMREVNLGTDHIQVILINTVPLFLYIKAKMQDNPAMVRRAVGLLESVQAEKNAITREFSAFNLKPENAWESQALIQLKEAYCNRKRCLDCSIGMQILNRYS